MSARTIRGKTAVIGIGETAYYKHGKSPDPEFVLALKAILAACEDAGIDPQDIDGFASYSDDRNTSNRLAAALGIREMRFSNMMWGGGGGGACGAIGNAAAAVACGYADCVVAFRALAQGQFGRFGQAFPLTQVAGDYAYSMPYGVMSAAQMFSMKTSRFMEDHGIHRDALKAIALAAYQHAQANPRAVMNGKPLTAEAYDESRWIVEPASRLFDCCQENDGAAAVIIVSAERAKDLKGKPAYILGAAQGSDYRHDAKGHNEPYYGTSNFTSVGPRLFEQADLKPSDVDVAQSYENFTGGVLMSLIEHGFCTAEEANEFFTVENLTAPKGRLPLNTSGGNLAEAYIHGLGLVVEGVRQIRGTSTSQVKDAKVSFVSAGPMVSPATNAIFGSQETV